MPSSACLTLGSQTRADIGARQALGLGHFDKFVARFFRVSPPPRLDSMLPASPAASLALLSIATDTLCIRLTEALAFDMFRAAFALGHLVWPATCAAESAPDVEPCTAEGMQLFRQLLMSCERDEDKYLVLIACSFGMVIPSREHQLAFPLCQSTNAVAGAFAFAL